MVTPSTSMNHGGQANAIERERPTFSTSAIMIWWWATLDQGELPYRHAPQVQHAF